jgi:hypothetical protein
MAATTDERALVLDYELRMFFDSAECVAEKQSFHIWVVRNSLIEAWALRLRIMAEFLGPERANTSDIHASDFLGDPESWQMSKDEFKEVLDRVNKYVAHLTHQRIASTRDETLKMNWDPDRMLPLYDRHLRTFAEKADKLPAQMKEFIVERLDRANARPENKRTGFSHSTATAYYTQS